MDFRKTFDRYKRRLPVLWYLMWITPWRVFMWIWQGPARGSGRQRKAYQAARKLLE